MDTGGISGAQGRDRKGKRPGRRARGLQLTDRAGYWYVTGRLWIAGRSIRVRKSLGLAVAGVSQAQAERERDAYVEDLKAKAEGRRGRGDPVAIAAEAYLARPRERPLRPSSIVIIQELVARFGQRRLNDITEDDWRGWIDGRRGDTGFTPGRMTGRSAATRERYLNSVLAFLAFARSHHGLAALPVFARDRKARNPNRRARRRVQDLRPELIRLLLNSAHIAIRAQLAVEAATGARVSSVLFAARLCDLVIGPDRAQITFPATKNGEDVTATLDAATVAILTDYLSWRGRLHDREGPLFLTPRRQPYVDNGRLGGGQNKTGFAGAKRRAQATLLAEADARAAALRQQGHAQAAKELLAEAQADAALLGRVTQHWFRHRLAARWQHDPRAAMEQGGWLDIRSLMAYTKDAPEHRHHLVRALDQLGTDWTQDRAPRLKKSR